MYGVDDRVEVATRISFEMFGPKRVKVTDEVIVKAIREVESEFTKRLQDLSKEGFSKMTEITILPADSMGQSGEDENGKECHEGPSIGYVLYLEVAK